MTVKIKLAKGHEGLLKDEDIKRELEGIQEFFDTTDFQYVEENINFVMLKGIYTHIKRSMLIVGVYVNKTDRCIYGMSSELNLEFRNRNAEIMTVSTSFPEEFIGKLDIDEGLLIHLDVPVAGLNEDAVFSVSDISGELDNIKIIKVEE